MAGTLVVDALNSSVSNTPPVFKANGVEVGTLCRAWVNFQGTGTVAIRASFNVSSVTDNGTGDYTVNFTNAMPDADYSYNFGHGSTNDTGYASGIRAITASSFRSVIRSAGNLVIDAPIVTYSFFR